MFKAFVAFEFVFSFFSISRPETLQSYRWKSLSFFTGDAFVATLFLFTFILCFHEAFGSQKWLAIKHFIHFSIHREKKLSICFWNGRVFRTYFDGLQFLMRSHSSDCNKRMIYVRMLSYYYSIVYKVVNIVEYSNSVYCSETFFSYFRAEGT